jgi:hypothetical protein
VYLFDIISMIKIIETTNIFDINGYTSTIFFDAAYFKIEPHNDKYKRKEVVL